jgi:hypothetical protein
MNKYDLLNFAFVLYQFPVLHEWADSYFGFVLYHFPCVTWVSWFLFWLCSVSFSCVTWVSWFLFWLCSVSFPCVTWVSWFLFWLCSVSFSCVTWVSWFFFWLCSVLFSLCYVSELILILALFCIISLCYMSELILILASFCVLFAVLHEWADSYFGFVLGSFCSVTWVNWFLFWLCSVYFPQCCLCELDCSLSINQFIVAYRLQSVYNIVDYSPPHPLSPILMVTVNTPVHSHWAWNKANQRYREVCFIPWPTLQNWQWVAIKNETLRQKRLFQFSYCELSIYR